MAYQWLRPLLFRLDPETAHHLSLSWLQSLARLGPLNPFRQSLPACERTVMGLTFQNPVGLAAGLDKNADYLAGLAALGFGFIEVGTVTPLPQAGNPKPRLFRLPEAKALINRMGFNNKGVDYTVEQVKKARFNGILGINIGKNRATPLERALEDYSIALRKVYPYADYIAVNISSPNTPGLRELQQGEHLRHLLAGLKEERDRLAQQQQKRVPLAIKIAPDLTHDQLKRLADTLAEHQMDAVIATNTTASRESVENLPHGQEAGGLSGKPLFEQATDAVRQLHRHLQGALPIIACGGILSPEDAKKKIEAGASLVQIYSGLIYQGPGLVKAIGDALAEKPRNAL